MSTKKLIAEQSLLLFAEVFLSQPLGALRFHRERDGSILRWTAVLSLFDFMVKLAVDKTTVSFNAALDACQRGRTRCLWACPLLAGLCCRRVHEEAMCCCKEWVRSLEILAEAQRSCYCMSPEKATGSVESQCR